MHIPIQVHPVHGILLILMVAIGLTLAGCTAPTQPPGQGTTQATPVPGENTVTIQNFVFSPASLTVMQGTRVTWLNRDTVLHQVASDASGSNAEGAIFSSPVLSTGESYSFTFNEPGIYPYHCPLHPGMKGTIVVR